MTLTGLKGYNKLLPGLAMVLALVAVYALEQAWPALGWWVFVVLTLSLGMGHGALDAVLLLAQFVPPSKALLVSAAYLLLTLLTAWVLSWSPSLALLALIVMSLWHFGELQGDVASRIAVGGASVMAPMVVAPAHMAALVQPLLAGDQFAAWLVWHWLAVTWCVLVAAWLVYWLALCVLQWAGQKQAGSGLRVNWRHAQVRAALEIACVVALYAAFSPLLAFALYFGVWHSVHHIAKVQQAVARHYAVSAQRYAVAVGGSVVLTLVFLGGLWLFLRDASLLSQDHTVTVLQWLIVALAALTLPHLLLVSHSRHWLKN